PLLVRVRPLCTPPPSIFFAPRFFLLSILPLPPRSPLFPYTTLFRSSILSVSKVPVIGVVLTLEPSATNSRAPISKEPVASNWSRSEEHTSELQSRENLVCRLLLEKKKRAQSSLMHQAIHIQNRSQRP